MSNQTLKHSRMDMFNSNFIRRSQT